ncbi:11618_t:CDS:2 [Ambispora gerdemannii]|uniref:11618_t:CDS:1 n=1 Tax=Ambispora gerdemannii TaxID=144530 RepID=A0A9N8V6H7_9GLOM|nr:11618_t:CDS:2 [Ambispora gerdemannii]
MTCFKKLPEVVMTLVICLFVAFDAQPIPNLAPRQSIPPNPNMVIGQTIFLDKFWDKLPPSPSSSSGQGFWSPTINLSWMWINWPD